MSMWTSPITRPTANDRKFLHRAKTMKKCTNRSLAQRTFHLALVGTLCIAAGGCTGFFSWDREETHSGTEVPADVLCNLQEDKECLTQQKVIDELGLPQERFSTDSGEVWKYEYRQSTTANHGFVFLATYRSDDSESSRVIITWKNQGNTFHVESIEGYDGPERRWKRERAKLKGAADQAKAATAELQAQDIATKEAVTALEAQVTKAQTANSQAITDLQKKVAGAQGTADEVQKQLSLIKSQITDLAGKVVGLLAKLKAAGH